MIAHACLLIKLIPLCGSRVSLRPNSISHLPVTGLLEFLYPSDQLVTELMVVMCTSVCNQHCILVVRDDIYRKGLGISGIRAMEVSMIRNWCLLCNSGSKLRCTV